MTFLGKQKEANKRSSIPRPLVFILDWGISPYQQHFCLLLAVNVSPSLSLEEFLLTTVWKHGPIVTGCIRACVQHYVPPALKFSRSVPNYRDALLRVSQNLEVKRYTTWNAMPDSTSSFVSIWTSGTAVSSLQQGTLLKRASLQGMAAKFWKSKPPISINIASQGCRETS